MHQNNDTKSANCENYEQGEKDLYISKLSRYANLTQKNSFGITRPHLQIMRT